MTVYAIDVTHLIHAVITKLFMIGKANEQIQLYGQLLVGINGTRSLMRLMSYDSSFRRSTVMNIRFKC